MLKFSRQNRKLHSTAKALGIKKSEIVGFDLPAGWTCPSAMDCKSKADRLTGKITDSPTALFRCYAASGESAFKGARLLRWHNFDLLKEARTTGAMAHLIIDSMPDNVRYCRIHTSGDFFNKVYFEAWVKVAKYFNGLSARDILFYGYTKQAQYLENNLYIPANLKLVVSAGGSRDNHAPNHPRSHVVLTAEGHSLPVYTDESSELAVIEGSGTFGLLIHGTQPRKVNQQIKELRG